MKSRSPIGFADRGLNRNISVLIFLWKDFERSCELLEVRGARAIKLSYSSLNRQEVEIKLTNRRTCLTFETVKD